MFLIHRVYGSGVSLLLSFFMNIENAPTKAFIGKNGNVGLVIPSKSIGAFDLIRGYKYFRVEGHQEKIPVKMSNLAFYTKGFSRDKVDLVASSIGFLVVLGAISYGLGANITSSPTLGIGDN